LPVAPARPIPYSVNAPSRETAKPCPYHDQFRPRSRRPSSAGCKPIFDWKSSLQVADVPPHLELSLRPRNPRAISAMQTRKKGSHVNVLSWKLQMLSYQR
jgi:hypothetical protein